MKTLVLSPKCSLGEFIETIYVNYSDDFEHQGIAEPFLNPELFISFGKHFQVGQDSFSAGDPSPAVVIGNRSVAVPVTANGSHYTAGVIFKPWGVYSAFGIAGKLTINQSVRITSSSAFEEFTSVAADRTVAPEIMLEKLESAIRKAVRGRNIKDKFQKTFAIVSSMSMEQANLQEVASKAGLSKRTVIQLFNEQLGLSPMRYIQVKTIIEALRILRSTAKVNLTGLALDLGFYDQSHFIRVFKSCMQMTPSQYVRYLARVNPVQF